MVSPTPSPTSTPSPRRKALHERSDSQTNVNAAIRLVPYEPLRLEEQRDEIYSRTPLPTSSAHVFPPTASSSYRIYEGLQGLPTVSAHEEDSVSPELHPAKSQATSGSENSTPYQPPQTPQSNSRLLASRAKPPLRKLRKHVAVDSQTKTFRVLDVAQPQDEGNVSNDDTGPLVSPASRISQDRSSSHTHDTEEPARSSTASWFPDSTIASTPTSSIVAPNSPTAEEPVANSPWNYSLVGGLRKVPKTPDTKQKSPDLSDYPLPPLPESPDLKAEAADIPSSPPLSSLEETGDDTVIIHDLSAKPSFQSTVTESTDSGYTNFKVYGDASPSPQSPIRPPSSSSNNSNYNDLDSSPAISPPATNPNYQVLSKSPSIPPPSSDSNYQVLGVSPTPSEIVTGYRDVFGDSTPSTTFAGFSSIVRPTYSHESLVVPPLKPRPKTSSENLGHRKEYSRESFRTGSFTSLSTVFTHEASEARVGSGSIIHLPKPRFSSIWANQGQTGTARSHMQTSPHVWSSQLSTVASESDVETERGSRAWSDARRSSGALSPVSRRIPSISSSMMLSENHSWGDTLEPPQATYGRAGQRDVTGTSALMVEDQDEHGDGITDMQEVLRPRPSRTRLSGFFSIASSDNGRTNTMRSTTSSRANSLIASSIPTWAKLYYGSGERRYLGAPGSSTEGTDSRPQSSFRSGSPDTANFPLSIYSPRRRPRDLDPNAAQAQPRESMEISPLPPRSQGSLIHNNYTRTRRVRTPSIWSPHLRHDRRSTHNSLWDPPSVNWSAEPGLLGRRNIQIVMFSVGFIFPLAWMIAALLPLPPAPFHQLRENKEETPDVNFSENMARQFGPMDEARYESARWWRNLNRGMAVLGILLIAAIIVLAVIGVRQGLK